MPIKIDAGDIESLKTSLAQVKNGAARALTRSLNEGAKSAKTKSNTAIRREIRLPARYIFDRIKINKATFSNQQSSITTPRRGVLMSYFLVRSPTQSLVHYNPTWARMVINANRNDVIKTLVKPGGNMDSWTQAFLITLRNSNLIAVAGREGGATTGAFKVFYGPSLSQVLNTIKDDVIDPELINIVSAELDRQTKLLLGEAF